MTPEQALSKRDWIAAWCDTAASNGGTSAHDPGTLAGIRSVVRQSRVVIWDSNIVRAASKGWEAFIGVPLSTSQLPECEQLWVFDGSALDAIFGINRQPRAEMLALLWINFGKGEWLPVPMTDGNGVIDFTGGSLAAMMAGEPLTVNAAPWFALLQFMRQEYVVDERRTLPRHLRRQAEMGRRPPLPEVSVITLRRGERKEYGTDHCPEQREWSCQWLVGAHWRRQFYPSTDEHKPVYIRPYVKGDPTKPLREPRSTIYRVTR